MTSSMRERKHSAANFPHFIQHLLITSTSTALLPRQKATSVTLHMQAA